MNILFFLTAKSEVAYIYEDSTMRQVLEKMEHYRYTAMPILKRTGEYVGTITEGDMLWAIKNEYDLNLREAEEIPVSAVPRHSDNKPVSISTDIKDLVEKALEQNFVPVTDDRGVFIGIITRRRVIEYFYDSNVAAELAAEKQAD